MHRTLLLLTAMASAAALVAAGPASAASKSRTLTVTVVEHADTDATTDLGATGDSAGDLLTFANPIYDRTDTKKVGSDQGYCVRVLAGKSYECTWTAFLSGGQVVVQGPFYDTKDSTLAITGGTGKYRGARGTMGLRARDNGKKYTFTYHIVLL